MANNQGLRQIWKRNMTSADGIGSALKNVDDYERRALNNIAGVPNQMPTLNRGSLTANLQNELRISSPSGISPGAALTEPGDIANQSMSADQRAAEWQKAQDANARVGAAIAAQQPISGAARLAQFNTPESGGSGGIQQTGNANNVVPVSSGVTTTPVGSALTAQQATTTQPVQNETTTPEYNQMMQENQTANATNPVTPTSAVDNSSASTTQASSDNSTATAAQVVSDASANASPRIQRIYKQYEAALSEINAETTGAYQALMRQQAENGGEFGTPTTYASQTMDLQREGRAQLFNNIRRITTERESEIANAIVDESNTNWDRSLQIWQSIRETDPQLAAQWLATGFRTMALNAGWSEDEVNAFSDGFMTTAATDELESMYIVDGKLKSGIDLTNADTRNSAIQAVSPYFQSATDAANFVDAWATEIKSSSDATSRVEYMPSANLSVPFVNDNQKAILLDWAKTWVRDNVVNGKIDPRTTEGRTTFFNALSKYMDEEGWRDTDKTKQRLAVNAIIDDYIATMNG